VWQRTKSVLASPSTIVVVAFLFRIALFYAQQMGSPLPRGNPAPFGYEAGRVAASIATGKGFSSPLPVDSGPTAWFTPVYPYLLAGVFKLFGVFSYASALVVVALNCAFSAMTCWPVFYISRRLFGPGVAAGSAWLWAFLPTAVGFPIEWIWDTSLSALMLALIVLATLQVTQTTRLLPWIGYGLLWALGILTNAALVSLLPFLLGWAVFRLRPRAPNWIKLAGAASLACLLTMFPWFVRNYRVFGQVVLFRSNFGLEFWLGNNEQVPDSWAPDLHPNDNPVEREKYRRMGEIPYMAEKQRLAIQFIKTHPRDFLRFCFHRFMNNWTGTWDPVTDMLPNLPWWDRLLVLSNCLFSILAFVGLLFASRSRSEGAFPLAAVLLIFPIIYYISHPSLRYRHPIDPVMTVLVVFAVSCPFAWLARRRAPSASPAAHASASAGALR